MTWNLDNNNLGADQMKHEELRWQTGDGIPIYGQKWAPEGEAKAAVCLVHGLGEHSGRYNHWAERLTSSGYALLSFDLRGHGKSGGQKGHTPSFDHYADDVSLLLEKGTELYPGLPQIIYGHSLGGVIVLYYLAQRRPQLTGAVVTSPALKTAIEEQKVKRAMALLLGAVLPKAGISNGLDQDALARDPSVAKAYLNDPLVHDRITFSLGRHTLKAVEFIFENAAGIGLPLLLLHGTGDRICYHSGAEELSKLVSGECVLKMWKDFYHELHNEPEKDDVFAYLKQWLDKTSVS